VADTKFSDATTIDAVADADEFGIADASAPTAVVNATALQLKTYVNTAPIWAGGTAAAGTWPKFTPGTLFTTPEAGAIELDADVFYGTTDAGNRGVIPVKHFIRCDSARTLPNDTNENAIFNSPTNGRITLETGLYFFEGVISISAMSATTGNARIDIRGAGTATMAAWCWWSNAAESTTTPGTDQAAVFVAEDSSASIATAGTGTVLGIHIKGSVEVTAAGTVIPSIDLVTAAAAIVAIGSYIEFERRGSTSVVSVGQWD